MNKEEAKNKADDAPVETQEVKEDVVPEVSDEAVASADTGDSDSTPFNTALIAVKKGKKIAREIWEECGLTVSWVSGAGKGKRGYFQLNNPKVKEGIKNEWKPDESEKEADDWYIVE